MSELLAQESDLVAVPRRARPPLSRRPSLDLAPAAFMLAHVPLGLAMDSSASIARLHGLLTVAVVLLGAVFLPRLSLIVYGVSYLAMAGVLWRMTEAGVPWEISKHGLAFVSIVVLIRFARRLPTPLVILYLALLVPGAALTVLREGVGESQQLLAFNLSGPVALAAGVAMFSVIRLELRDVRRITYFALAPVAGIWVIAFRAFIEVEQFTTSSNVDAVGGFGPNQVSTVLGLGSLMAILWVMREPFVLHRLILIPTAIAMIVQSTLTFSRGGLYNVVAALVLVMLLYLRRPSRVLFAVAGGLLVASLAGTVIDELDEFTGGAFVERFSDTDVTGRDEIARADLDIWAREPITGVGAGRSRFERADGIEQSAAHTEFTRLAAEHGVLGIMAIGVLGLIAVRNLRGRSELWELAWSMALMAWTAGAMTNAAMRTGAASFAFALASARLATRPRPAARHASDDAQSVPFQTVG